MDVKYIITGQDSLVILIHEDNEAHDAHEIMLENKPIDYFPIDRHMAYNFGEVNLSDLNLPQNWHILPFRESSHA